MRRMSRIWRAVAMVLALALLAGCGGRAGQEPSPSAGQQGPQAEVPQSLRLMAPAAPGGGWDQTTRALQKVIQDEKIVPGTVEVFNVPGAGGTVGLAQLVGQERGKGDILMTMGLVMVGAVRTNKSPVTLADVTPIARLTAEYEVIVVPADSPYQTLQDLIAAFKADPRSIAWGGGSAGGVDHILVGLIAKAAGVAPADINYIPFSGGGEATAAVLGGHVTAGVAGYGEWEAQIQAGQLRALAISAPERLPGVDIPTLKEQGFDIELANWRGVVAAPGITEAQRQGLLQVIERVHQSAAWQRVLEERRWNDAYLAGDDFAAFLRAEDERVTQVLREIGLIE